MERHLVRMSMDMDQPYPTMTVLPWAIARVIFPSLPESATAGATADAIADWAAHLPVVCPGRGLRA